MTGLADAAVLSAVAIGSVRGSSALGAARWPRRSPRAAILLWQALGLGGGLAAIGALIELGVPPGATSVANGITQVAAAAVRHLVPTNLARFQWRRRRARPRQPIQSSAPAVTFDLVQSTAEHTGLCP
jgi:hypothetical protein